MTRAVVTGAAAGIGRAVAQELAREGRELILVDRDAEGLAQVARAIEGAGGRATVQVADFAARDEVEALGERLVAAGPLGLVVHNAGINLTGPFARGDAAAARRVTEVNLLSPMRITGALLRGGAVAQGGSIAFVSSLSRFVSYPGAAVYAASKDGLASYARSLALALSPRDIHVLTIYPGPTRTEHARRHSPDNSREDKRMPPEVLAQRICRAIARRRRVLIPAPGLYAFAGLGHFLPRVAERAMRKTLFDKMTAASSADEAP